MTLKLKMVLLVWLSPIFLSKISFSASFRTFQRTNFADYKESELGTVPKTEEDKKHSALFCTWSLKNGLTQSDCYFELTTCFPDEFKPLISPKMVLKDDILTLFLKTFQMLTLPNTTFWTAEFQFPVQKKYLTIF